MQAMKIIHEETEAVLSEFSTNNMTQKPSVGEIITIDEIGTSYQVKSVEHFFKRVNCKRDSELRIMVL
tara:strand:- start:499 stop:702 length:204 start_codon:yes stop_codon:yes gene_type:complete